MLHRQKFAINFEATPFLVIQPNFVTTKVPILKEVNFRKMQLCRVEHLLNTFSTYLSSKLDSKLCNQNIGEGKSNFDDKYVEKVFNKCSTRQSCIFPKFTSYKIGTLDIYLIDVLRYLTSSLEQYNQWTSLCALFMDVRL